MCNFLRTCRIVFQSGCTVFHSHRCYVSVPISSHPTKQNGYSNSFSSSFSFLLECRFVAYYIPGTMPSSGSSKVNMSLSPCSRTLQSRGTQHVYARTRVSFSCTLHGCPSLQCPFLQNRKMNCNLHANN